MAQQIILHWITSSKSRLGYVARTIVPSRPTSLNINRKYWSQWILMSCFVTRLICDRNDQSTKAYKAQRFSQQSRQDCLDLRSSMNREVTTASDQQCNPQTLFLGRITKHRNSSNKDCCVYKSHFILCPYCWHPRLDHTGRGRKGALRC